MHAPLVAIVGAPNVGKSTLFNRLIGRRRAIVSDEPGVTRDRLLGEVQDAPRPFRIVDTGGITLDSEAPMARQIEQQARMALEEAAVVVFLVDARAGASGLDQELAEMLRRLDISPLLVANKVDSRDAATRVHEFHRLGLGAPLELSAEHGNGIDDLLETIAERLPPAVESTTEPAPRSVAIVGRPNVGKSSLVNRLLGEERVLVSEQPGTTRDAVDTLLEIGERRYVLIDTAGLRRPGRIRRGVERFSAMRARENIGRCDVAVVVLDASEELTAQDARVAGYVLEACKPQIVVVNKWDLIEQREAAARRWAEEIRIRLKFTRGAPLLLASARSGQRVIRILDLIDEVHAAAGIRVPTHELNRWLRSHPAAAGGGGSHSPGFRLLYATQIGIHPPSFVLFCNDPERIHFSVRRRIENGLRETFGFGSVPLRLTFRGRREAEQG